MRNVFLSITLLLIILSTSAFSNDRDTPWMLSWPFFQSDTSSRSINNGYGDWCIIDEGMHPGLDFGAVSGDSVLLPTDDTCYLLDWKSINNGGSVLLFGENSTDTEGWAVAHLSIPAQDYYPVIGSSVSNHQALAPCSLYNSLIPLHMHLQWIDNPISPWPPGLYNPFNSIEDILSSFDEVQFKNVVWEEFLTPSTNRGIWFTADHHETYEQLGNAFGGLTNQELFQNIVYSAVDIAVAPFSAFQGLSDRDSAGVYSVAYAILRQDPISLAYLPAAPDTGNFGQRWLIEMRDELPYRDCAEYRAIFPDGLLPLGGGGMYYGYYMNAYIVTNSGALDTSNWITGWDNVWIDPTNNDWENGICQGAWDTFLAKPEVWPDPPSMNSEAFFPDGRYAVEVTAVSHGFRDTAIDTLPVNDLSHPFPTIDGVVVDNFIPSIEEVKVYSFRLDGGHSVETVVETMYTEIWEDSTSSIRKRTSTAYGYLPSVNSGLGIAVRYSEIMDPENMGYYWFTGERADEVVYTTEDDRTRWLRPVEGFREDLGIVPSSPEAAYWQCYETSGDCSIDEIGYVGKLSLHIGDLSTPLFALDLAGNEMDYDPSTIPTPRDPVTGEFNYSLVEPVPYDTGIWGNHPFWVWNSAMALVDGYLGSELVATVDLESIGLGPSGSNAIYVANNRYWCGFWMRHSQGGELNEYWPIVDFNGVYTLLIIYTEFPVVGGGSGNQQYWHSPSYYPPVMSPDTRYMWRAGRTVDWLHPYSPHEESKAYVYCLDSETGMVQPESLCVGWCWFDVDKMMPLGNSADLFHDYAVYTDSSRVLHTSFSEILSVDTNGVAEVRYGYYTTPDTGGLVQDTILIEPNWGRDDPITTTLDERPIATPTAEIAAEVNTNPVHDVLTVNLLASSGSRYEIVLYDISGRRVLYDSGILTQDRITIDNAVNYLPSGVYLLRISTGDMEVVRTISIIH